MAVHTLLGGKVAEFVGIAVYTLARRSLQESYDGLATRAVQTGWAVALNAGIVATLAGLSVLVSERPRSARQALHCGYFQVLYHGSAGLARSFPGSIARRAARMAVCTSLIRVIAVLVAIALNALQGGGLVVGVVPAGQTVRCTWTLTRLTAGMAGTAFHVRVVTVKARVARKASFGRGAEVPHFYIAALTVCYQASVARLAS